MARRVGPEAAPFGYVRLAISQNELDLLEAPFRRTLYQVSLLAGLLVAFARHRHPPASRERPRARRAGVAEAAAGRHPIPPAGSVPRRPRRSFMRSPASRSSSRLSARAARRRDSSRAPSSSRFPSASLVVDRTLALLDANPAALAASSRARRRAAARARGPRARPGDAAALRGRNPGRVLGRRDRRAAPRRRDHARAGPRGERARRAARRRRRRAGRRRSRPRRHGTRAHGDDAAPLRLRRVARAPDADRGDPRRRRDSRGRETSCRPTSHAS